jgi:hypothetical protein
MTRRIIIALSILALAVPLAHAQQPPAPRGVLSINGGWQASDRTFSDPFTFDQYAETARADIDYAAKAGPVYEGGLGVRVWKALGFGVSFSSYRDSSPATVSATIPHPFFFGRARAIEGSVSAKHEETSINAQIMAFVPAGSRVLVIISAGPSLMTVRQTLVTAVRWDESYPYDTSTFRAPDTKTPSGSVTGFNAGADLVFRFGRSFGIGALVRYTQAKVDLSPADGRTMTVDVGGLQAGAGIRLIF